MIARLMAALARCEEREARFRREHPEEAAWLTVIDRGGWWSLF